MTLSGHRRVSLLVAFTVSMFGAEGPRSMQTAREYFERGMFEAAEREFEKSAATDADAAEANFWLGEIALRRNDPEKAIATFERSVALTPSVSRYHHRLGDAYGRAA